MISSSVIQAAIDAAVTRVDALRLSGRVLVDVEPGDYEVTETIVVNKCVDLNLRGVSLFPPAGVDAIRVVQGGDFSILRGGVFIVGPSAAHAGIGIDIQAHHVSVIDDPFIREMGTGIRVYGPSAAQNSNAVRIEGAVIFKPHHVGIYLNGGEVNAGNFDAIEIVGSPTTEYGVLDESFLGNLFRGLHVSTTTKEAVRITKTANYGTWEGCYIENNCGVALPAGSPKIASQPGVTWLGGNVVVHASAGDRVGMGKSQMRFEGVAPNGDSLSVTIPHPPTYGYLALGHISSQPTTRPSGGAVETVLRRRPTGGLVEWCASKLGQMVSALAWTRSDHPNGRGLPVVGTTADTAIRRVPSVPAATYAGDVVEVVDLWQKTRRSYLCEQIGVNNDQSPLLGWTELT